MSRSGIDRDEQRVGAVGVLAQRAHDFRHLEQRGRADIGAMRVAEEHQERLALHVLVGDRLAVLIDQLERPADRRGAGPAAAEIAGGVKERRREKSPVRPRKADNAKKNMGRTGGHRDFTLALGQKHATQPVRTISKNTAVP